jgi:hypothetical protein
MSKKIVSLKDKHSIADLIKSDHNLVERFGRPKKTKITITDHDTGEVLGEYENKVIISGSMFSGCKIFGIDTSLILPSYNDEMHFDNDQAKDPENYKKSIVQLFCVGDDGCGATQKDVFVCNFTDRIKPLTDIADIESIIGGIYPFRFQDVDDDLPEQLREYYFGKKTYDSINKIAYFFKAFDTTPELHVMYTDGTQVDDNMYNNNTDQVAECYVETRLRIARNDFRDFFADIIGWDNARISSLSLCYAWEIEIQDGEYTHKYYQDIYPYTKLNFPVEWLVNLDKAIDFNYQVYY